METILQFAVKVMKEGTESSEVALSWHLNLVPVVIGEVQSIRRLSESYPVPADMLDRVHIYEALLCDFYKRWGDTLEGRGTGIW